MSKVVLVAGMCENIPAFPGYDIIGIDRGAYYCTLQHIPMVCAVGDFDSVSEEEKHKIEAQTKIVPLAAQKNETDTEVAVLHAIQEGYDEIVIYGGLGGRLDHELANLSLLIHRDYPLIFMNEQNRIRVLKKGTYLIKKEYTYLSFLALEESCITETNVAYPLQSRVITPNDIYSISNEILQGKAAVTIHYGRVLMIEASDKN